MKELLESTTSEELAEAMAYYSMDPWDEERADLRAGIVASTLANLHRKKDVKPFTAADFMPYAKKPEPDPDDLSKQLAFAFGKKET